MDLSLILFVIGFLVVVYLIFKFITKVVFAIITVVILIVLIVAGIGGLVYLDFKSLSSQENFVVKVIHTNGDQYLRGIEIPFENGEPIQEKIVGISDLSSIDVDSIDKNSGEFVILIEDDLFRELIQDQEFSLSEIVDSEEFQGENITFDSQDILDIIDSDTPRDEIVDIVVEDLEVPDFLKESVKPIAKEVIVDSLDDMNITVKQLAFGIGLKESVTDEENTLKIIQGFKDDEIRVYPDRIVFDVVKLIPAETIQENIPENIVE